MGARSRVGVGVLAGWLLVACAGTTGSEGGGDCVSQYLPVAGAPTLRGLKEAMVGYEERGRVFSLRTQARGVDVGGGDQDAVRVVDLLGRNGRRLAQVEVWRTESGAWRAGIWSQCID